MKQGWVTDRFQDVVFLQEGPGIRKYEYQNDGYPMINVRCVQDGFIDMTKSRSANYELATTKWKHFQIEEGDILFTISGTIGRSAIVKKSDLPLLMNTSVVRFRPLTNELDRRFLYHIVRGKKFQDDLINQSTGTAIKNVGPSHLKKITISYPPIPEQKRIVAKLDKAFTAIDQAKANVERNLQNAKDLFQSELNRIFSQKGDGWVERVLSDIGQIQTGTTPPTKDKSNYGNFIPFVKPSHFNSDGTINAGDCMLSKSGLSNGRLFPAYSVLMVCIGATIGKTGFSEEPVSANQQINCLTPTEEHNPKLFYFGLISPFVQKQVADIGKGAQATLPIINKSKWQKLKINIPVKKSIQDGIVIQLNELRSQAVSLEKKYLQEYDALNELKKSILQKAFNGEL